VWTDAWIENRVMQATMATPELDTDNSLSFLCQLMTYQHFYQHEYARRQEFLSHENLFIEQAVPRPQNSHHGAASGHMIAYHDSQHDKSRQLPCK
jgi:hypothetical protein